MRDAVGSVQSVLLLGGTSDIGLDIARALVADRARTVVLAARDTERAEQHAAALRARTRDAAGAERRATPAVDVVELDAARPDTHEAVLRQVFARPEGIDLAIVAAGILGRPGEEQLLDAARLQLVNGAGAASLMAHTARAMRAQGRGTIVLLSSVAAERPRASNFAYGASKAAADAFARGLQDSLHGSGVEVMIVRPGFVRTKMTASHPPAPGAVDADAVTRAVVEGLRARRAIVYVPGFLRWVMLALRLLPRAVFRRLPL
jgi:decaprenylphospho-beta-D-erythro-pentofuranosid-2-ulose 2-reductase